MVRTLDDEFTFTGFGYRVLLDVWSHASAAQWRRRAEDLEAARPRVGDFTGRATSDELTAAWDRLTTAAAACRRRADYLDGHQVDFDQVLDDIARSAAA